MNTDSTPENTRPFGFWVTAVDRLLEAEFATLFADEGVTRRDWRLLNRIDGTVPSPRLPRSPKLRTLQLHGWIERTADGWALTDAGRLAKERLGAAVEEIRARVASAVSPEEYQAMTASLEKIAREFGWQEGQKLPRPQRGPRGIHRHGHHGHGHHGQDHHDHPHGHDHHHGHDGHHPFGPRHGWGPRGFGRGRPAFAHDDRHPAGDAPCAHHARDAR